VEIIFLAFENSARAIIMYINTCEICVEDDDHHHHHHHHHHHQHGEAKEEEDPGYSHMTQKKKLVFIEIVIEIPASFFFQ
jgi:hypothetical protein